MSVDTLSRRDSPAASVVEKLLTLGCVLICLTPLAAAGPLRGAVDHVEKEVPGVREAGVLKGEDAPSGRYERLLREVDVEACQGLVEIPPQHSAQALLRLPEQLLGRIGHDAHGLECLTERFRDDGKAAHHVAVDDQVADRVVQPRLEVE